MGENKYSNYSAAEIMTDMQLKVSELIVNLATTEEMKEKIRDILNKGGTEEFSVCIKEEGLGLSINCDIEANRRIEYAYFLAKNPEAFETIKKYDANLFHGTRVKALPSILKHGINSFAESQKNGIEVTTGEYQTRKPGKNRGFISFTDSIGTGLWYASLNGEDKDNSFGVMIGISPDSLENLNISSINSDVREVGIKNHVPLEYIKVLTVPKEKVEYVKRLVGDLDIEVVGAEMQDPFYKMPTIKKIEYLMKPEKTQQPVMQEYEQEDMAKNAKTGKLSRIMELLDDVKARFARKDKRNYGDKGR